MGQYCLGQVTAKKIKDGAITHAKLADDAVEADKIKDLEIKNADLSAAAAIAKSKLDFGSGLVNADIADNAAIVGDKLYLTDFITNARVYSAAAIAYSKLNLTGNILNADINNSAAIATSKINYDFISSGDRILLQTIPLINTQIFSTGTGSYVDAIDDAGWYSYAVQYPAIPNGFSRVFRFCACIRSCTNTIGAYAQLYDITAGSAVADSAINPTRDHYVCMSSGNISIPSSHEFKVQFRSQSAAYTAYIKYAAILVYAEKD